MIRSRIVFTLSTIFVGILALSAGAERRRVVERAPLVPTFATDVYEVFERHCQACHRPEGAGPFSLVDYETAYEFRFIIRHMTQTGQMPPWKAALDCGDWRDPNVLSEHDKDLIARWIDAGAPEGNREHLPPRPTWPGSWTIGEPDQILRNETGYDVDRMEDSWRCFVYDTDQIQSRYLSGIEILNDAQEDVHHMIAYLDTSGQAAALDASDPAEGYDYEALGLGFEPSGVVGLYTPGERPFLLPDGIAIEIPDEAKIVLQVHYHPHDDHHQVDRPQIGLHFADTIVRKRLGFMAIYNGDLFIPANQKDVLVEARQQIDEPISILTMGGHMHYLGQRIRIRSLQSDGTEQCLLRIDAWDQRWQGMYHYRQQVRVPAGSEILVEGWYDNTNGNPLNPHDPPRDIYWGEAAEDEMLQGYLTFTRDLENSEIEP